MFKHPTTTGFRGPLTGTLLCLTLVPLLAPADPPAADTGGTDKTVFTESDSMLQQTAGADYSVFGIAYVSDDPLLLDLEPSVPQEFPTMSVAAAYSKYPTDWQCQRFRRAAGSGQKKGSRTSESRGLGQSQITRGRRSDLPVGCQTR